MPSKRGFLKYYFQQRLILVSLGVYYGLSLALKYFYYFDVTPKCLSRILLQQACPACGLSRALVALCQGNLSAAYAYNPLIFFVLPCFALVLGHDVYGAWFRYKRI